MASQSTRRLQKEYKDMKKAADPNFEARPDDSNILLWYYVIRGSEGTPYEGGRYMGKIRFTAEYPFKPPSIMMVTPSGRFQPDTKLCLSISDFHPETWNPMWNASTIILGLISFMNDSQITAGSIESSDEEKKMFAVATHRFNSQNPYFQRLFPELHKEALEMSKASTTDEKEE